MNSVDPFGLVTIEELEQKLQELKELGERYAREISTDRPAKIAKVRAMRELVSKQLAVLKEVARKAGPVLMCLSILDRLPESIEEAERQDRSVVRQIEQEQKEEFFALPLELLTNIKDTIEGEFADLRR